MLRSQSHEKLEWNLWVVVNVFFFNSLPNILIIALCFSNFWKDRFPEMPTRENKIMVVKNMSLPRFGL